MIEFYDSEARKWRTSRFGWTPEDIAWLNDVVGWTMYRQSGVAA